MWHEIPKIITTEDTENTEVIKAKAWVSRVEAKLRFV